MTTRSGLSSSMRDSTASTSLSSWAPKCKSERWIRRGMPKGTRCPVRGSPPTPSVMDRTEANTGTREVAERLRFDEAALADWMADHVEGFQGPLTVRQFKGG